MTSMLERFRPIVTQSQPVSALDSRLLISQSGNLSTYYAPFEHVNTAARVVLVGITPGLSQAQRALEQLRIDLCAGLSDEQALQQAKETASFSGSMRSALVDMLDSVGVHSALGVDSCSALFGSAASLVHYTSALRNPTFAGGQNYTGSPTILRTPYLRAMAEEWLAEEARMLPRALWIPLGKEPTAVLRSFIARSMLPNDRVLDGMPHPSGANSERIAYFLGRKPRHLLSPKTKPETLDTARTQLIRKLASFA